MRRTLLLLPATVLTLLAAASGQPGLNARQVISTVAGGGPDNLPVLAANLSYPAGMQLSRSGDLYFVTLGQGRVFRVDAQGEIHVVAGSGGSCVYVPYGDGLPARDACFTGPFGIAVDGAGNIYVSDTSHHAVRRVDAATGIITRFAGNYSQGYAGDGGPAASARLNRPYGLALDAAGNLFIVDRNNHSVRRVDAVTGIITTVVGTGFATGSIDGLGGDYRDDLGDGRTATQASLKSPFGVTIDGSGNIFIGDTGNVRVRRVDAAAGTISTYAGNGSFGFTVDGAPATQTWMAGPEHLALDSAGNLFIADSNDLLQLPEDQWINHFVRRVDAATHTITTVAGTEGFGFAGDGGPATSALLWRPCGLALDSQGDLLIADENNDRIRKVTTSTGVITTMAGSGERDFSGDGSAGPGASLIPGGLAVDAAGNLLIADSGNHRVRRVDAATGIITTVAGNGSHPTSGDGGPALAAGFDSPAALGLDSAGNIFIADAGAGRVRRVDHSSGIVTTVAGQGLGYGGDGGPATSALLNYPEGVAAAPNGDIYIADTDNDRVRRVRSGIITTVAGTGYYTGAIDGPGGDPRDDLGDGGQATSASLSGPASVLIDPAGDLVFVDFGNERVRRLDLSTGIITTIAGDGVGRFAGDGGPATSASLRSPEDVSYDAAGNLYIADSFNDRVRRVDAITGIITSVAGDGTRIWGPDGRLATATSLYDPANVALDAAGRIYVTLWKYSRVRVILPQPPPAAALAEGADPAVRPLDVIRLPNGDLTLAWSRSCLITDNDYVVYEGTLGDWTSHAPRLCSTGGATAATITPGAGDRYYLVVPRNALVEGSFGARSDATPRPEGTSSCLTRLAGAVCQ